MYKLTTNSEIIITVHIFFSIAGVIKILNPERFIKTQILIGHE